MRGALRQLLAQVLRGLQSRLLLLEVLLQERDDVLLAHRHGVRDQAFVAAANVDATDEFCEVYSSLVETEADEGATP